MSKRAYESEVWLSQAMKATKQAYAEGVTLFNCSRTDTSSCYPWFPANGCFAYFGAVFLPSLSGLCRIFVPFPCS